MKTMNLTRTLMMVLALVTIPAVSEAQAWRVGVSIGIAPPPLPVYVQPPCPAAGYLWVPGYWAYDPVYGYYWVPGTWALAPAPGLLWTPGYWGFEEGLYAWHRGYWGPQVGFYGGVNYGFGYFGTGFGGGRWDHGAFFYNRSVTNVNNVSITNVYNQTVVNDRGNAVRTSFNGGAGGIQLRPTARDEEAARGARYSASAEQTRHESEARQLPALRASINHGQPAVAATPRASAFAGHGVIAAEGRNAMPPRAAGNVAIHRDNPAPGRPPAERRTEPRRPAMNAPQVNGGNGGNGHPYAVRQPAVGWNAPERAPARAPAPTRPAPMARYAQPEAPPPHLAQAPMSLREPARAPARFEPGAAANRAPARSGPPEHEGGRRS